MTDSRTPGADGELLSAYLAGDLSEADADLLEHRLAAEPALAAQLDALAAALVELSAAEQAQPPAGYEERLRTRLAAEAARGGATGPAGEEASREPGVASLDVARAQRRAPTRWWAAVGTVAAVAVAGAVMAGGALRVVGGSDRGATTAGEDTAAQESAPQEEDMDAAAGGEAADSGTAMTARPTAPELSDDNARLADEDAVLERYAASPQVQGLLGIPLEEAADLSATFTSAVQQAPSFADGTSPAACLDTITADAEAPLIPVVVETVRYDGTTSLAYVFVTATPQSDVLDRLEVWVVTRADCATQVFVQQ